MNKLCEDCAYFTPDVIGWSTEECRAQYAICSRTSLVTKLGGNKCETERNKILGCGKMARYFEEKSK